MRIVIDLQGAQSNGSARRGIGRYSSSLARAMAEQSRSHEIIFALNGQFPEFIEEIRSNFGGLVPPENFKIWCPQRHSFGSSAASMRAMERLHETFIASLNPDVVHVASLFEGFSDSAVTSIGKFTDIPTATTLYDLIPLLDADHYLAGPQVRAWYAKKIDALRRSGMWFAISESSRREGVEYLSLPRDLCINVSTAADDHFVKISLSKEDEKSLRNKYNLRKPFVMYTGGIDRRKNIEALIRAFANLNPSLRARHQLAIVCAAQDDSKLALFEVARQEGLEDGEVILTGFVPENDLIALYNLCKLFVFPSWHEGFGLPALEAMKCGAAVIAANTSSLPEVIGRDDALFDPKDDQSITGKMTQALTDEGFRRELVAHGETQSRKFSWPESANRALDGLEALYALTKNRPSKLIAGHRGLRPRLAYVSPVPPLRTGIADYSAELLPELALHYDVDLITDQSEVSDPVLAASLPTRSVEWFKRHAAEYDRILYHFGNSIFHEQMFELLAQIPGVVVLHDFFLSGVLAHLELHGGRSHIWREALYKSHGYAAVEARYTAKDLTTVIFEYPCSFSIFQQAQGIIVHSPYSLHLAKKWYGSEAAQRAVEIPHLRVPQERNHVEQRNEARKQLGLKPGDFLVCSFGILGPTKLNDRLLRAWAASPLATDPRCKLVFVGENAGGEYGTLLEETIDTLPNGSVEITGWASSETFRRYLHAADLAVQLRSKSRGETSGTVLDTMNQGIATIVNAHGSMAHLPEGSVLMLPDQFEDAELQFALTSLRRETRRRTEIGQQARATIEARHSPSRCAAMYRQAIEGFAQASQFGRDSLVRVLRSVDPIPDTREEERVELARAIADSLPAIHPGNQLLLDISTLANGDAPSALKGLSDSALTTFLQNTQSAYRIEPVYEILPGAGYRYARQYSFALLNCPADGLADSPIEVRHGDFLVTYQLPPDQDYERRACHQRLRNLGVTIETFPQDDFDRHLAVRFPFLCDSIDLGGKGIGQTDSQSTHTTTPDANAIAALEVAGIVGLEQPDFNHLLHHLRGEELSQLPQNAGLFISVGCAGTWYFNWIQQKCNPQHHVGIEYYSPKPDDLPPNVQWISNTAGDMSSISNEIGDILFSGQNIEHLWPEDIVSFLSESHRVLKPGGLLVVDSPNRLITKEQNWSHPEHILEFTPAEAKEIFEMAGFEVVALRGTWLCQDPETKQQLRFNELTNLTRWPLLKRIEVGKSSVDQAFSWWIEARKGTAMPDMPRVKAIVDKTFKVAWPERVNRLIALESDPIHLEGVEWLQSRGRPGVIMFGPYMPLPAGSYEVRFSYRAQIPLPMPNSSILEFDVVDGNGLRLAERTVCAADYSEQNQSQTLRFVLRDTTFGIQFRAMALGDAPVACQRQILLRSLTNPIYSAT